MYRTLALVAACDLSQPKRVHRVDFKAQWGGHDNWYHYIYGRLAPLLSWAGRNTRAGDAILLQGKDSWSAQVLRQKILCGFVVPFEAPETWGLTISAIDWPQELGWDMLLYGMGSLKDESKTLLARELNVATELVREACSCQPRRDIVLVDRGPDAKRSIPNLDELHSSLSNLTYDVRRLDFGTMHICDQWCAAYGADLLIGQHGAGLANAFMLRENASGLIEITPDAMNFKRMYPAIAKLRGAHYERVAEANSHAGVDVGEVLEAVRRIRSQLGRPTRHQYPRQPLSKHMKRTKCPTHRGTTNILVRSGECKAMSAARNITMRLRCNGYVANDQACGYAVATMANQRAQTEFELFYRTYVRYHPNRQLYVACDSHVAASLHGTHVETLQLLDKYGDKSRKELVKLSLWTEMQLQKATVMAHALKSHSSVLFVDCDLIMLAPLPAMQAQELGLSKHNAWKSFEKKYGKYNGGMVFVRNSQLLDDWRNATRTSTYFEQLALETLAEKHAHFDIDSRANVGWQRFMVHNTSVRAASLLYRGSPIQSLHIHLLSAPSFYPDDLVPRLLTVLNELPVGEDLCATSPQLCLRKATTTAPS